LGEEGEEENYFEDKKTTGRFPTFNSKKKEGTGKKKKRSAMASLAGGGEGKKEKSFAPNASFKKNAERLPFSGVGEET